MINTIFVLLSVPTYSIDIAPIIMDRCSQCHSYNWPEKNWQRYEIAYKFKDSIKIRMKNKTMPPDNSTELTEKERALIIKWVDTGAKE
jgi:uncharacterized membrane protein